LAFQIIRANIPNAQYRFTTLSEENVKIYQNLTFGGNEEIVDPIELSDKSLYLKPTVKIQFKVLGVLCAATLM
jgi:hypothetical protein